MEQPHHICLTKKSKPLFVIRKKKNIFHSKSATIPADHCRLKNHLKRIGIQTSPQSPCGEAGQKRDFVLQCLTSFRPVSVFSGHFCNPGYSGKLLQLVAACVRLERETNVGLQRVCHSPVCVSDFATGVHLVMIGGADRAYLGTYLWTDTNWKNRVACKVTGSCLVIL